MGWSIGRYGVVLALLVVVITGENEGIAIWQDGRGTQNSLWDGNEFSSSMEVPDIRAFRGIRGASSPIRDEAIVVGLTKGDTVVTAQMYAGGQWSSLPFAPLANRHTMLSYQVPYNVRYESLSGNPLIVWLDIYATSTGFENKLCVRYATRTGSGWSMGIVSPSSAETDFWMSANPKSNEVVLFVRIRAAGNFVMVWNGVSWGDKSYLPMHTTPALSAFEQQSGRAMLIYGVSHRLGYQIWNGETWSRGLSFPQPGGILHSIQNFRIAADPSSNRIVVGVFASGDGVDTFWATVWDGNNSWESTILLANGSRLTPVADRGFVHVAFEGTSQRALAVYMDLSLLNSVSYRTWSPSSGWSDEERGPSVLVGGPTNSMVLNANNENNDVMLAVHGSEQGLIGVEWNGTAWGEVKRLSEDDYLPLGTFQSMIFLWKPVAATKAPTPFPTSPPTRPGAEAVLTAGHPCSNNKDCQSNTCRNGVCMATSACYPLKHKFGEPFYEHKVNIVFVASGFDTGDEEWHTHVNRTYESFESYNMFSNKVEQLNMFRVDPLKQHSAYCAPNCFGIARLLCCDKIRAQSLAEKCFPVGSNLQTVVIHNDRRYAGGGYVEDNIATVSTHPLASVIAAHELGHSLFDLADEYHYGSGTESDPNCASTSSCDKWSDLIGNTPDGYEPVRCVPGCQNDNYYVGTKSFMADLKFPMGAVNERFACCAYYGLTKSFPWFCNAFDLSPNYLLDYCKTNDYQGYGRASYEKEPMLAISNGSVQEDSTSKYVWVEHPELVSIITKKKPSGDVVYKSKPSRPLESGMFLRSRVKGDFSSPRMARKQGFDSLLKVTVFYAGRGGKERRLHSRNATIEVPFSQPQDDPLAHHDEDEPVLTVSEMAESLNIIVDTMDRPIKAIRVKVMNLVASRDK